MFIVYLLYGAAFLAMGAAVGFQATTEVRVLSRRASWLLALFGLTHGAHEWTYLVRWIGPTAYPHFFRHAADETRIPLLIASYLCLLAFGSATWERHPVRGRWARRLAVVFFGVWLGAAMAVVGFTNEVSEEPRLFEAISRYFLAFPGASLAGLGLWVEARRSGNSPAMRRMLGLAGAALVAYGLIAGLVPYYAPFFPASVLNVERTVELGVSVVLLRAACAIIVAGALSWVFSVEITRMRLAFEKQREEFISIVAHDMRSAVGAVLLGGDLLRRKLGAAGDSKELQLLERMTRGAETLRRMLSDLLDVSLVDAKRLDLKKSRLELSSAVPEILHRCLDAQAQERQVEVTLPQPVSNAVVEADPTRLEQVLTNLISNATKYSDPGTEIRVKVEVQKNEVHFLVTNRGPGIRREDLPRLFDRFFRTEHARGHAEGLGLGLVIVKGLVEAHGGRVWVTSEPGQETSFGFALPRAQ